MIQITIPQGIGSSGVYLPVASLISNLSILTLKNSQWLRVGNTINVSGGADINITAALTATAFDITLPVPSLLTGGFFTLGGTFGISRVSTIPIIFGQPGAPGSARFSWTNGVTTGPGSISYIFSYLVN